MAIQRRTARTAVRQPPLKAQTSPEVKQLQIEEQQAGHGYSGRSAPFAQFLQRLPLPQRQVFIHDFGLRYGNRHTSSIVNTLQRFAEAEHREIGDTASGEMQGGKPLEIELGPGLSCSFGELNALADHFGSKEELKKRAEQGPDTQEEVRYVLEVIIRHKSAKDFSPDLKKRVEDQSLTLAAKNPQHFTNPGALDPSILPKDRPASAGAEYRKYHEEALLRAFADGVIRAWGLTPPEGLRLPEEWGSEQDLTMKQAMFAEGFATHFLEDSFASGHIMAPRAAAGEFWDSKYPTFWTNLKWWMAEMIAKGLAERKWYSADLAFHGALGQQGAKATIDQMTAKLPAVTLGDLIGLAIHDYYNVNPIPGSTGSQTVPLYGDDKLGQGSEKELAVKAVKASLADLQLMNDHGAALKDPQAFSQACKALQNEQGLYLAETMVPTLSTSMSNSLIWKAQSIEDLLGNDGFKAALELVIGKIVTQLKGTAAQLKDDVQKEVFEAEVIKPIENNLSETLKTIINFVPDTGGGVGGHNVDDNAMDYIAEAKQAIEAKSGRVAAQGLAHLSYNQKVGLIRKLIPGKCEDDEEQAINELLRAAPVAEMEQIVTALGEGDAQKGIDYLDSGIDGAEWDECERILRRSPALFKKK